MNKDKKMTYNKKIRFFLCYACIQIILFYSSANQNIWAGCKPKDNPDYMSRRLEMIQTQILSRGVRDPVVLDAMDKVPRHEFVPEKTREDAYIDSPLSIGEGQTISQPYIVAFMSESLKLQKTDKVLEIGTGSGYQAAILAEIVEKVFSIEIICKLADRARERLTFLGYNNIEVRCGDGYKGWPDQAPFDKIIVTAAPYHIPQPLVDQLKMGGLMIIPVGEGHQELVLIKKTKDGLEKDPVLPVRFVPMTGEAQKK